MFPSDMHSENIFIHWLNDNSYYKDKKIKNITEIVYKINKKLYKIKTFGFVIILGDLGMSLIKIRKDVILASYNAAQRETNNTTKTTTKTTTKISTKTVKTITKNKK